MDLIKIHFEFRSKHNKYFGQPRVRSMGLPVPTSYPKCNNAVEVEKTIYVGKCIQTIIIILNNLNEI
jgi:hypothetical protein